MTLPLVSVIIPNYNNEKYVLEAIKSVLEQTYKNIEVVVVDDVSTDNSVSVITNYYKNEPRLKLIVNNENKGVSFSRNTGVLNSKGDFISTLDSDDTYSPEKIEREMKVVLSMQPRKVIAFSSYAITDVDLNVRSVPICKSHIYQGDIYKKILYRSVPFARDMLMSKEIFFEIGGFDEHKKLYEDWDFKLKLAKKYHFIYSGCIGVNYRQLGTGLSSVNYTKHLDAMVGIFSEHNASKYKFIFKFLQKRNIISICIKKILSYKKINDIFFGD